MKKKKTKYKKNSNSIVTVNLFGWQQWTQTHLSVRRLRALSYIRHPKRPAVLYSTKLFVVLCVSQFVSPSILLSTSFSLFIVIQTMTSWHNVTLVTQ